MAAGWVTARGHRVQQARLIGTRVASSLIDSFTVGPNGELASAPGSPFPTQTGFFGPLGSEFSPIRPDQLFVSNAHTASGAPAQPGSVAVFTDEPDGVLSTIAGSPFFNDGAASCWVEISHDGRFLYPVNTGSSTVSIYSIAHDGTLSFSGSTSIGGAGAEDARLAPTASRSGSSRGAPTRSRGSRWVAPGL